MGHLASFIIAYAVAWLYVPASWKEDYGTRRICHAAIFLICFSFFLWYPCKAYFLLESGKITHARAVRIARTGRFCPLRPRPLNGYEKKESALADRIYSAHRSGDLQNLDDFQLGLLRKYGYSD